jgi:iron(III) transport system substrate-binding protein
MREIHGRRGFANVLATASLMLGATQTADARGEINIDSYRERGLTAPLFGGATDKTGVETNVVFARGGLHERLAAERALSPADVQFTVVVGRLSEAGAAGLTQPLVSGALQAITPTYRDPDGHWFNLTNRARVAYASRDRVELNAITYEALADPKWKRKICTRSGQHVDNTSLAATIIAHKGEAAAEAWLPGLKANLTRKPAGGDRKALREVKAGLCDIANGNTDYVAAMFENPDQTAWADSVRITFPHAGDGDSHINISGMAIPKHAKNKDQAIKLSVYLASNKGRRVSASINTEYPVSSTVQRSDTVNSRGTLKPDQLLPSNIAKYRRRASELVDKVAFDAGTTN